MKFTNNRKKAVNLNPKTEGKYSWDLGSVCFDKEEKRNGSKSVAESDALKAVKLGQLSANKSTPQWEG